MNKEQRVVQMRMRVLDHANKIGNVRAACHYYGIPRSTFFLSMEITLYPGR